jgi:hypothetical protein
MVLFTKSRGAALLALVTTLMLVSACGAGGIGEPTETIGVTEGPAGGVTSPGVTSPGVASPAATPSPGVPSPGATPSPGQDQGIPPVGGPGTGAGGTAQGVNLGLLTLGALIAAAGAVALTRRQQGQNRRIQ